MNIWGFFPDLALVEYHTKWIRIMRGPGVIRQKHAFWVETVKESRNNWDFHFDLQLVPIVLEVTFVYCQGATVISQKAQNFQSVE